MDEFVKNQLHLCDCGHVTEIFLGNEIDEVAFRKLNIDDLRVMLPSKVGLQKKIMDRVELLRKQDSKFNASPSTSRFHREPGQHRDIVLGPRNILPKSPISQITSLLNNYSLSDEPVRDEARKSTKNDIVVVRTNHAARPKPIPAKILKHKKALPIYSMRKQFLEIMKANQIVIIKGETGSGKSTQLTQYLYEDGFGTCGKIACTQPRRIAAKSLAKRVAEEMGTTLGDKVGYRIRFENNAANDTSIVYMTDGILLQEIATEPKLYSYSVIMLDEAHERSLNTDVLLGLLKSTLKRRRELKVLIASATMDCSRFSEYFNGAPIFEIPGRVFPVDIIYAGNPEPDYVTVCISQVMKIHRYEKQGDILIFLGGQEEIERTCDEILEMDRDRELWVLPCYASLSIEDQNLVFDPVPQGYKRKVVVATNIAETSITIDGIVYVIDSGIVKQKEFDPQKRIATLNASYISQAQAIQRSGRAGRTQPGKAYRLYSQERFKRMPKSPIPEIQRNNLESVILLLAAHGIENIYEFDFIDKPNPESIQSSLTELKDLQALDSRGACTQVGREMCKFPLEPKLSKMLITSAELNCLDDALTIVSMLSVQSSSGKIFLRPKKYRQLADKAKAEFFKPEGDHLTLLNVFTSWELNNYTKEWCRLNYINYKSLEDVIFIRDQLQAIVEANNLRKSGEFNLHDPDGIQKALVSGYFSQVALKAPKGHGYLTYSNPNPREYAYIHPASALFKSTPRCILFEELMNTGKKAFLINCVAIEPRWIQTYAPGFYQKLQSVLSVY